MGYSAELTEKQKLPKVLTSYYAAIEAEKVDDVMAFYHSKCTLPFTPEGIRQTFAQVDYRYKITNIRYIGDDGINFVIIYREQTEFWIVKEGKKKLTDQEDSEVLMVFRREKGRLKIFSSNPLK